MQMPPVAHLNLSASFRYPMNRDKEIERTLRMPSRRMVFSREKAIILTTCHDMESFPHEDARGRGV